MSLALDDEGTLGEVVDADDAGLTSHCEVLVGVRDRDGVQLVGFTAVRARLKDCLGVGLSEVPVGDLLLLADGNELVVIHWCDREGVDATHALGLRRHSLLSLEVPAEDRLVSGAGQQVLVIREELNLGHTTGVFLQVRDKFARADFPDTNFALHAT